MATHHSPNLVTGIISHIPLISSEQCTISCTDTATWCARAASVCLASWEGFWTTWKMAAKQGGKITESEAPHFYNNPSPHINSFNKLHVLNILLLTLCILCANFFYIVLTVHIVLGPCTLCWHHTLCWFFTLANCAHCAESVHTVLCTLTVLTCSSRSL